MKSEDADRAPLISMIDEVLKACGHCGLMKRVFSHHIHTRAEKAQRVDLSGEQNVPAGGVRYCLSQYLKAAEGYHLHVIGGFKSCTTCGAFESDHRNAADSGNARAFCK